jgi:hypothetical protein
MEIIPDNSNVQGHTVLMMSIKLLRTSHSRGINIQWTVILKNVSFVTGMAPMKGCMLVYTVQWATEY